MSEAKNRQMVPFHYVMSGQTAQGDVGVVTGVVEFDLNDPQSTRAAGFAYVLKLLFEQMGTNRVALNLFSFERNTL